MNAINSSVTWEFKKKKAFLKNDNEVIVELKSDKKKCAGFKWEDKTYTIRNRGFWNPLTVLENEEKKIMSLKRFFRTNKAFIEFENGNKYLCRTQNAVFVKLAVYSPDRKEIIRYKLISKYKASMQLNMDNADLPDSDLIFLIVLGCFVFRGIIRENKFTDIQSVVFSSAVPVKELPVSESLSLSNN
ncbi:MAG TPA: hypothetical protein VJY62_01285 [Bacteroidia bacterium]|nr:hypothetical protein [Bacteroidia bacterium]